MSQKTFQIETGPIGLDLDTNPTAVIQASIAISLKRIADALEKKQQTESKSLFEEVFGKNL